MATIHAPIASTSLHGDVVETATHPTLPPTSGAGRYVGLHRIQSARRFRDTAVPGDSRKEIQIGHVHTNQ